MLQNGVKEHEGAAEGSGSCPSISNNPAVTWVPARNTRMWKSVRSTAFILCFYSGLFVQNDDGESEQTGGKLLRALLRWGSATLSFYSEPKHSNSRWMLNKRTSRFISKPDLLFLMFRRYLHSSPFGYPSLSLIFYFESTNLEYLFQWQVDLECQTRYASLNGLTQAIPNELKAYWHV